MDLYEIEQWAAVCAQEMVEGKRKELGIPSSDSCLADSEILNSPMGTSMVRGFVLGAIDAYHEQFRETLLEKLGVDIGPLTVGGEVIDP